MVQEQRHPMLGATQLLGNVPRKSVRDLIAEKIAMLISSGVLSLGDELPGERELAASLSVSRETVRGAIGILAAHGILRVTHGARTVVAKLDTNAVATGDPVPSIGINHDLESVYEARLLIERHLARAAAGLVNDRMLGQMRASLDAQRACDGDPVRFLLCDRDFHALIYRSGGNDVLADAAMALYNHLLDHRRRIVAHAGAIEQSIADHDAIVDAMADRDADRIEASVIAHATRIFETTRAFMDARQVAE